jgi:hypothetical protein
VPVQIEGKYTFRDMWHGTYVACRKTLFVMIILGILSIGSGAFIAVSNWDAGSAGLVLIGVGIFWIIYLPIIWAFRVSNSLKRTPNLQGIVRFRFEESGYAIEALHSQAEGKWEALVKWKEGKHAFLLYANPKIGTVVPKSFFRSAADVDAVRRLLETKLPKK